MRKYLLGLICLLFGGMMGCQTKPAHLFVCEISKEIKISVPENKYSHYHTLAIYNDSLIFGVNINNRSVIDVYDIKNEVFCKEITLPCSLFPDMISGLYIHNMDSIYFCQGAPNAIFLINDKGYVLNSWKGNSLEIDNPLYSELSEVKLNFSTFINMHFPVVVGKQIYIPFDPAQYYKLGTDIERVGCYDMKQNRWIGFLANTKDLKIDIKSKSYPVDLEQPYILKKDSLLVVTYPMDDHLYCYNIETNNLINTIKSSSYYVKKFPKPLHDEKLDNCQKVWNFRVQTPFFGPLFYHEKIKKFSRILHHPQPLINSQGNVNDGKERCSSIQIFDDNFNLVGETLFTNGELGVYSYLPLSDGLIFGSQADDERKKFLNYDRIIKINSIQSH